MSLQSLLNQVITISPKSGQNDEARETYGTAVNYKARVQEITKTIWAPNGASIVIDALCMIEGSPAVSIDDKLIYKGITYRVHGKKVAVDGQGNEHHVTLQLIKANI